MTEPKDPAGPVRVALVGAGNMARHHVRALHQIDRAIEVVQVYDPDAASRERLRESCPSAVAFAELDAARLRGRVDTVHICTPPPTHVPLAAISLEAGCHVYVEKPLARTESEAISLLQRAREGNLTLCAGHQLLFEAPTKKLLHQLPAVGTICHLESYFAFRPSRGNRGAGLPADEQIKDILPHPLYSLLRLFEIAVPHERAAAQDVHVGRDGTIHAQIRAGELVGSLIVTLTGRPVESYLKVVGDNGTLQADYVRGLVLRALGPGSSSIDKLLQPYRTARQLAFGTTRSMARRVIRRQRSYPGLREIFEAFYGALAGGEKPLSERHLIETTRLFETICDRLEHTGTSYPTSPRRDLGPNAGDPAREDGASGLGVVVTGGTGFLGKAVVEELVARGVRTRVLARRVPAPWERVAGVEYWTVDLGSGCPPALLDGFGGVIHCAAETRGGWEAHERNSLAATKELLAGAAAADVRKLVHVSSVAVLASSGKGEALHEGSPLESDERGSGPYVWGKLASERRARELGHELGVEVKIARPGAIIDSKAFEPPGRLGRRIGRFFVAVGSPNEAIGVVERPLAARTLVHMILDFDRAPDRLHLLDPEMPTRRDLVTRLQQRNPDLRVFWLPRPLLRILSLILIAAQKIFRPKATPIRLARAFAAERYDTSLMNRFQKANVRPYREEASEGRARASVPELPDR